MFLTLTIRNRNGEETRGKASSGWRIRFRVDSVRMLTTLLNSARQTGMIDRFPGCSARCLDRTTNFMSGLHELNGHLEAIRETLGPAPRSFPFLEMWGYLRIKRPRWAWFRDDIRQIFWNRTSLLRKGRIVWGHIVQANAMLFSPGELDAPAAVVYCTQDRRVIDLAELSQIASQLFDLKGKPQFADEQDRQAFSDRLADEMSRPYGLRVPKSISPRIPCAMSTIFIARKHLPGGYLKKPLLPLLVATTPPHVTMVVPDKYWPKPLFTFWHSRR